MTTNALANHLDALAEQTWFNLTEARRLGMRMGEVTITEANLLSIARFLTKNGLAVELVPTKADESKTGADFEIWFDIDGTVIGYAFQAKVLKVDNTAFSYREIGKKDKHGEEQSALLERHARKHGAFPFHVLFNGWAPGTPVAPVVPNGRPLEHFGCAAIPTPELRCIRTESGTLRTRSAADFLPLSMPWSHLLRPHDSASGAASDAALAPIDVVPRLIEHAHDIMGNHTGFGGAGELPDYVRDLADHGHDLRDGPARHIERSDYRPPYVLLVRISG